MRLLGVLCADWLIPGAGVASASLSLHGSPANQGGVGKGKCMLGMMQSDV